MRMEKKKVSGEVERKVVIGAIMSSSVCKILHDNYEKGYIASKAVSYILETCIEYYARQGSAPAAVIQDIFEVDTERGVIDEDTESLAASLLESCSNQFEQEEFNHDYYSDLARKYISGQSLSKLSADLKANVERGRIEEAEEIVDSYQGVATSSIDVHNPFTDPDLVHESFDAASEPLLRFRGAYGEMVNDLMVRGGFVAIMGPEKRGKTFQLIEFAIAGLKARKNVAFFSLGDMSKQELTLRIAIRLSGLNSRKKYCKEHWEPVIDCVHNQDDSCTRSCRKNNCGLGIDDEEFAAGEFNPWDAPRKYKTCIACTDDIKQTFWYEKVEACQPLEWRDAYKTLNKFYTQWVKGKQFKMCCVPNGSLSITGIHNKLNSWSKGKDPFIPDILITDYMDIADTEPNRFNEFRHSENEKWKAARRLAQTWHALHISATQADAASYKADIISEENFSEDKRKYGHVTGILGLNQTPLEKRLKLMRINAMFLREEAFHANHTCTQLQNLNKGRPHLDSFWG